MKKLFLVFLILLTLFNSGCDNGFDIVTEYKEQLIVFLVLDNRSDKQIIKVQKLQKSYGRTVSEKLMDPISVRIVHPLGYSRNFKDTVINSVYNFNTLYVDSLDLIPGAYQLFVNAKDSLYAHASMSIGLKPLLIVSQDKEAYSAYISMINYSARGAHIKPYLLYTVKQNAGFVEKSIEVPRAIYINKNDTVEIFSGLVEFTGDQARVPYHLRLVHSSVQYMRDKLTNYYGAENVQFNNMKFISYAYDWNLFEYINANEGYSDEFSVRLDKPNFTNIVGGMGIFGAVSADSVTVRIYN